MDYKYSGISKWVINRTTTEEMVKRKEAFYSRDVIGHFYFDKKLLTEEQFNYLNKEVFNNLDVKLWKNSIKADERLEWRYKNTLFLYKLKYISIEACLEYISLFVDEYVWRTARYIEQTKGRNKFQYKKDKPKMQKHYMDLFRKEAAAWDKQQEKENIK